MKGKLPHKVSLQGPSGNVWDVDLLQTDDLVIAGDGWKAFVKAYSLEENCLLQFKFTQNSSFEVLIFNGESLCEKEASYFVQRCTNMKPEHENIKKRSPNEASSTEVTGDVDDYDGSEFLLSKKLRKGNAERLVPDGIRNRAEGPRTRLRDVSADDDLGDPVLARSSECEEDFVDEIHGLGQRRDPEALVRCPSDAKSRGRGRGRGGMISNRSRPRKVFGANTRSKTRRAAKPLRSRNEPKRQSENKPSGNNTPRKLDLLSEVEQMTVGNQVRDLIPLVHGASSPEMTYDLTSFRKSGTKLPLPEVTRKLDFKDVSAEKRSSAEYMSNRRPVTDAEKADALKRASKKLIDNSFIAVMRPTNTNRRFYLNIPCDWMHKNLPPCQKEVILRIGNKTWSTVFYYYNYRASFGGINVGWKKFALDNNLEESDVCLFRLGSQEDDAAAVLLDVEIFRVVDEVVPPSPVTTSKHRQHIPG